MHTASYEFLMKPKESAGCHQTLSSRVGSGDETTLQSNPHDLPYDQIHMTPTSYRYVWYFGSWCWYEVSSAHAQLNPFYSRRSC